jgi:anaerobic magnesium-protoporphyrin IX monomethyl ester cyclase
MKVLLMLPLRGGESENIFYCPDLGLGYLAQALRTNTVHPADVSLLINNLRLCDREFTDYLRASDFSLVGLKVFATNVSAARRTIALVRAALPQARVVVGGPQPTGDAEHILEYIPADFGFAGEAELGLPELARLVDESRGGEISPQALRAVPGLIWKHGGSTLQNPVRVPENLDELGAPAWDLMPPASFPYQRDMAFSLRSPIASFITSRGCPFQCTFCSVAQTPVRQRSVENVMQELTMLHTRYGVREFHMLDNSCGHRADLLIAFCRALIESKLDITWNTSMGMRATSINAEVLSWLKKSRCTHIWVGIESGSPRILEQIKKRITVEDAEQAVKLANRARLGVTGYFMLGLPGETRADIQNTIDFSMKLGLQGAVFNIFTPVPGTPIYRDLAAKGRISPSDFDSMDQKYYRNSFTELDPEELIALRRAAYWRFHLRPRIILGRARFFAALLLRPRVLYLWIRYVLWNLHLKRRAW